MVSSDEIRRRLEAKRRGESPYEEKKVDEPTVNCPECQTPNLAQAKFCVGCGKPLPKEEAPTVPLVQTAAEEPKAADVSTGTKQATDSKVCPSCGQKNKPDAKFCIICGHKFEEEGAKETAATQTEEKDETSFPSAQEVVESPSTEVVPEIAPEVSPEVSHEPVPEVVPEAAPEVSHEDATAEEVTEPPVEEPVESPAETRKTPVVPEIKVPENFKSKEPKTDVESQPADIPETAEAHEEPDSNVDPVEKIKKAKELLDIGAITQEDFDKIKNKYLEQI